MLNLNAFLLPLVVILDMYLLILSAVGLLGYMTVKVKTTVIAVLILHQKSTRALG